MSEEPPKKKARCNKEQKAKLVELMVEHRSLALGIFSSPMGRQVHNAEWESVAAALAELGPSKTVDQWKTTWRDLKSHAKSSNAATNRAVNATGNTIEVPTLSRTDNLILSVIGRTTSQGLAGVPESPIGVSLQPLPTPPPPFPPPLVLHSPPQPVASPPQPVASPPPPVPSLVQLPPPPTPQPPTPPQSSSLQELLTPLRQPPHSRAVPEPSRSRPNDLASIYSSCSHETTAVLSDISNHMKRRNDIELERNTILKERNQILLA